VGITTIAARPGTGIGTTSGIAKNIREVPKELSPIALTIFSTVKSSTPGLFAKISRRICEVRFLSTATTFLTAVREPFRVVLARLTELSRAGARFAALVRAAVRFDFVPGLSKIGCGRAVEALMRFLADSLHLPRSAPDVKGAERDQLKDDQNSKLTIAFCPILWNARPMPRGKVALSGLLAFGAGVAVGASWPRAGNIVGYLLQRLGFEFTDLALWVWDPEKSLASPSEVPRLTRSAAKKKAQADPDSEGSPFPQKSRAKAKKRKRSSRVRTDEGIRGSIRKEEIKGSEAWISNSRSEQSTKPGTRSGRLKAPQANGSRFESEKIDLRSVRKKQNSVVVNQKRKSSGARRGSKAGSFPRNVAPVNAALN
jgi:hypothetical protein